MLDTLPNELLVKIFINIDESTARSCRLLNSRINNVIEREEVYKKKLTKLEIGCIGPESHFIIFNKTIENEQYCPLEEIDWNLMLQKFQNCRKKLLVELYGIYITKGFMKQLMEHKCLRKMYLLRLQTCTYDDDGYKEMLKVIPAKKLSSLYIEPNFNEIRQIPQETLIDVSRYFECKIDQCRKDYPNLTHFTDELLDTWVSRSKTLRLDCCLTGFTLNGIANLFKECMKNNIATSNPYCHLGILPNVGKTEVGAMLQSLEGVNMKQRRKEYITYTFDKFNGRSCLFSFSIFENPQL